MQLSPLDLLDAARRWREEVDVLGPVAAKVANLPASAFCPGVLESARTCAAVWADAADRIIDDAGRCAEGLRDTAELGRVVDADVAAAFDRMAGERSR